MSRFDRQGLTLIELTVVIVVVVVLLSLVIPILRERERKKWEAERAALQARADRDPDEVFDMNCWPAKETFRPKGALQFVCEVSNPTAYPLEYAPEFFVVMPHEEPSSEDPVFLDIENVESVRGEITYSDPSKRYPAGAVIYGLASDETIRFKLVARSTFVPSTLERVPHSVWLIGFQESARSEPFTIRFGHDE